MPNRATAVETSRTSHGVTPTIPSCYHHHHPQPPPLRTAATAAVEPPGECLSLGPSRGELVDPASVQQHRHVINNTGHQSRSTTPRSAHEPATSPPITTPPNPLHHHRTTLPKNARTRHVTVKRRPRPPPRHHQPTTATTQTTTTTGATSWPKVPAGGDERREEEGTGRNASRGAEGWGRGTTTVTSLARRRSPLFLLLAGGMERQGTTTRG